MAHILAIAVGLGSLVLYMAAFFLPEVHRKYDFVWSGVAMFYALVLWICDGRMTGGVLLGQMASVALLGWLGWQTLQMRRQLTPALQQTPLPDASRSFSDVTRDVVQNLKRLRRPPTSRPKAPIAAPSPQGTSPKVAPGQQRPDGAIAPPPLARPADRNDEQSDDPADRPVLDPARSHPAAPASPAAAIATPPPIESGRADMPPPDRRPIDDIPTATVLEDESLSQFEEDGEAIPGEEGLTEAPEEEATQGDPPPVESATAEAPLHAPPVGASNGGLPRGAIASESLALRKPLVIRAEIIGFDEAPATHPHAPASGATGTDGEDWGHPPEPPPSGDEEEWF